MTLFSSTLAIALGLTPAIAIETVVQAQPVFRDVAADHWASVYIENLAARDILSGFPDGRFRPNATVTRAEFAAILQAAFLPAAPPAAAAFRDVPADHWAADAIQGARAAGFLSGYPGNLFYPEQPVSRVQAVVALASGLGYGTPDTGVLAYYTDRRAIPDYALSAVAGATAAGIVVSYPNPNQFNPNQPATRADIAALIYQTQVERGAAAPLSPAPYAVVPNASEWSSDPRAILPVTASQIDLSGDGQRLLTVSDANTLQIWQTQRGDRLTEISLTESARLEVVAINDAGTQVAASVQTPTAHQIRLWQVETGDRRWQHSLAPNETIQWLGFSANADTLLSQVASDNGTAETLQWRDLATGQVAQSRAIAAGLDLNRFAISPNGRLLAGVGYRRNPAGDTEGWAIAAWDLQSGEPLRTLTPDNNGLSLVDAAFNPTGHLQVLGQQLYQVRLETWNLRTGERLQRLTDIPDVDRSDRLGRLSPDGQHYFVRSDWAGTRLINLETRTVRSLPVWVRAAVFDREGNNLAIATQDDVRIYGQGE